jgi:hypothetical protein
MGRPGPEILIDVYFSSIMGTFYYSKVQAILIDVYTASVNLNGMEEVCKKATSMISIDSSREYWKIQLLIEVTDWFLPSGRPHCPPQPLVKAQPRRMVACPPWELACPMKKQRSVRLCHTPLLLTVGRYWEKIGGNLSLGATIPLSRRFLRTSLVVSGLTERVWLMLISTVALM